MKSFLALMIPLYIQPNIIFPAVPPTTTVPQVAVNVLVCGLYLPVTAIPVMVLSFELGAAAVSILIDRFVPRLSSPRTLLRYALTAAAYLLGVVLSICCTVAAGPTVRKVFTTPNQLLSPEWKFPDDGLDADTRRYGKQWLIVACHLLALWVASLVALK